MKTRILRELLENANLLLVELMTLVVIGASIFHWKAGCPPLLQWAQGLFLTGIGLWLASLIFRKPPRPDQAHRSERLAKLGSMSRSLSVACLLVAAPMTVMTFL